MRLHELISREIKTKCRIVETASETERESQGSMDLLYKFPSASLSWDDQKINRKQFTHVILHYSDDSLKVSGEFVF